MAIINFSVVKIWMVKIWQIHGQSPNFPFTKVSLYTVLSSFMLIFAFSASISELTKIVLSKKFYCA